MYIMQKKLGNQLPKGFVRPAYVIQIYIVICKNIYIYIYVRLKDLN